MANNFYSATVLIGGGTGALDAINGTGLADLDAAMVQTDGTVYFYHLDATSGAADDGINTIAPDSNAGTKRWILQAIGGNQPYIKFTERQASGTSAGTFTQDAWQTRNLTDEDIDTHNLGSLAANVMTIAAGTYRVFAASMAYRVDSHISRLWNTTDNSLLIQGSTNFGQDAAGAGEVQTDSIIIGEFTITASKTMELQHYCKTTKTVSGFGVNAAFGVENIYAQIEFRKIR